MLEVNEVWKPIPGHDNYAASTLGRIKNRTTGRILKPQPITSRYSKTKYLQVGLSLGAARQHITKSVHRLVALTFLGPSPLTIQHIDSVKTNNRLENLRYESIQDNVKHAIEDGLMKPTFFGKLSQQDVEAMRQMRRDGMRVKEIAARYNIALNHCYSVMAGRRYKRFAEAA